MKRALCAVALVACGDSSPSLPPTSQDDLLTTLNDLAAIGEKHAGTPGGQQAAAYLMGRMQAMGLSDVHTEAFTFPQWQEQSKALTISIDGTPMTLGFDVFESSGSGTVTDVEVVDAGTASDADLARVDVSGKIALVQRDPSFHRAAQYKNLQKAGAVAMLYLSIAPDNLRQVGSVRFDWESAGTIPAITVGADDGAALKTALANNQAVSASIAVQVTSTPGTGTNVVGVIRGERPETLVLGAHFDTWFAGSADNGGGVAELLAVADRRVRHGKPKYTLVFVAYDGEEIGLYGGYDYYRDHVIAGGDPVVAVLNFESPSANDPEIAGLVHSNQPKLDEALKAAHLRQLYGVYAGLEVVAQLFGGIIPTDIQGVYRSGTPTVTTAVTNDYYHTTQDTPDKVDLALLAESTDEFDVALDNIMANDPADYQVADPALWTATATTSTSTTFDVDVTLTDGTGAAGANAVASAVILYDDFLLGAKADAMADANGHVVFHLPTAALTMGSGGRFLHVSGGPTYPLVEKIVPLP